ncbi:hypothetical protein RUMHYD_02494 [Blautia hydrogenotrophica DSM 10507]|uniref:Uncharacterized protein n=1 Tax=Blautia hydrogenotrophica (strain DSM 10507 / JCM 14656 / S5a33) TaxID=476272 RepID=C0CNQ2_BLAHS|nr:hypothetical protein RUMHYD_02494 [Blautia hydrogenotrophica DSM 10507]
MILSSFYDIFLTLWFILILIYKTLDYKGNFYKKCMKNSAKNGGVHRCTLILD